jgi:hypothetical protein
MRGAREAHACRRVLAAARPLGRPDRDRGCSERRSLLAFSGFAVPKGVLRTWCPSCESSSSASSRGATPAMALLRFSAPGAWVGPPSPAPRVAGGTVVRIRRPCAPSWRPGLAVGLPPPPQPRAPLQSVPSVRGRNRLARFLAFLGFPAPRSSAAAEPLQGVDPSAECLAVLEGPLVALLGFSPLGRSPPPPWRPVWPGPLLLRASPPVPVGSGRRRPGVLRCDGSGVAVSGAGPSGVCDL